MKQNGFQLQDFSVDDLLNLMEIYLSEWAHRSDVLWRQIFYYFYATMIVLFLPYLTSFIGITLPDFPELLFPVVAVIMSCAFLYVSLGLAKRIDASVKTYHKLVDFLPVELRVITIVSPEIRYGKFFRKRMSVIICFLLFFCLISMSIVMIVYTCLK